MITALGQKLTAVSTTQKHVLGERCIEKDANGVTNEYIYLKGVASTAIGSAVNFYPLTFVTALLTKAETDKLYPVAVAMAATVANTYGWYQIKGVASIALLVNCAKEVALYTSATAGSIDDDSTTQTKLNRTVALATITTAAVTKCWIDYPSAA
jgi:hypothetical protein